MGWQPHDNIELEDIKASLVIVSDSLFSGISNLSDDVSGPKAVDILSSSGITSINLDYYPDDIAALKGKIESDVSQGIELIICIGGTGIAKRDVTIEAVESLVDKTLPGFGEEFRRRSYEEIKEKALLSRSIAGVFRSSLIIALPGSPNAVEVGLNLLLGFVGHAIKLMRKDNE